MHYIIYKFKKKYEIRRKKTKTNKPKLSKVEQAFFRPPCRRRRRFNFINIIKIMVIADDDCK